MSTVCQQLNCINHRQSILPDTFLFIKCYHQITSEHWANFGLIINVITIDSITFIDISGVIIIFVVIKFKLSTDFNHYHHYEKKEAFLSVPSIK